MNDLPAEYGPANPVVWDVVFIGTEYDDKKHIGKMRQRLLPICSQAQRVKGVELYAVSGYRSYDR